ncbi:MAG TPA: EamA family transporter [Candidatus Acidoferrum sp.]|nr:EamA family transporter [Candidatus Acidoferrum sp.]
MKKFHFAGFGLLMMFDTLSQVSFKYTATLALPLEFSLDWVWRVVSHIWLYGAILGYIGAFFTWMTLLKRVAVGPAFAASHLEVISVMLLSWWLFNEPITVAKVLGALLILGGIVCLAVAEQQLSAGSQPAAHE